MRIAPGRHVRPSRGGIITLLLAVSLMAVIAIAALAVDVGQMFAERQQVRLAADAAAMAAANELYEGALNGTQATALARAHAESIARDNGYPAASGWSTVQVRIPPQSGSHAGDPVYAEITVESRKARGFSSIFGSGPLTVVARSVAGGGLVPTKGSVLVLDAKSENTLQLKGHTSLLKTTGDVIVNTKNKKALKLDKGAQIQAENLEFATKLDKSVTKMLATGTRGEVHQGMDPTPDPYAGLPVPDTGPAIKLDTVKTKVDGKDVYHLTPGTYQERLHLDNGDGAYLDPGVYTFKDGIDVHQGATFQAQGVTLYVPDKGINFSGDSVTLSPPTSGPYAGISIFAGRDKKSNISFKKDASLDIQGVIYAPNSTIRFQNTTLDLDGLLLADDGSSDSGVDDGGPQTNGQIGASIIASKLTIDKNSTVNINGSAISATKPILRIVE